MKKLFLGILIIILLAACSNPFFPPLKEKEIDDGGSITTTTTPTSLITITIPGSEVTLTIKRITSGGFLMGSPDGTGGINGDTAEPNRITNENFRTANNGIVTLTKNIYMGIYPVTQEQYEAVMGTNPSNFKTPVGEEINTNKRPVESVNWYHAIAFCNRLSILTGLKPVYTVEGISNTDAEAWKHSVVPTGSNATWNAVEADWTASGYRLPTEAEWEYSCRAGTTTPFSFGTTINDTLANFWATSVDAYNTVAGTNLNRTSQVGIYAANANGLYDMHGNVWEWCWDWYTASYDSAGGSVDPVGPTSPGSSRVLRGGSWDFNGLYLRSAYRNWFIPDFRIYFLGFRVVLP